MKALTAAAIVVALLLVPTGASASPNENRWRGPCSTWQYGEGLTTPALFNADLERSQRMMRRQIACVFDRFAPGNASTALYVADRESSFYPWAVNASSGCLGLFQHIGSAWSGRAHAYLWRGWFRRWPAHWADPRAQAIVSSRMVAAGGWGPWSL
jgi:hypothetical protein